MLIAGYAKPSAFARSSIWAYTSGVAMGIFVLRRSWGPCPGSIPHVSGGSEGCTETGDSTYSALSSV
jgi:hypothetical protein